MRVNSPSDAEVVLQKLRCDMGIHRNGRKGTLNAPERILEGFEFDSKDVLVDEVFPDEFDLEETHNRIRENTEELLEYGLPLISVGGDHSVSFPVLVALKSCFPDLELVWLDSHLDLKRKVDDNVSHDVVVRELLNNGFSEEEITFVGITKIDGDEEEFLEDRDIDVYWSDEVDNFLREFEKNEQPVYLSIDIDVLKESEAPGTGYPDGKLEVRKVERVIKKVEPDFSDLVEVAPPLDNDDITINNSRKILKALINN